MKVPGRLVQVNDTEIHVYHIPDSITPKQSTIIFLSGSGTECPTYDFKPLWHLLAGKYSMAIVERPGYGWSGITKYPRDIDTILEETREALKKAGITAPFVPAAHSLSGLEAIYWAQKYPDEISAMIGLDMAVPQVYNTMELPKLFGLQVRLGHLLRGPIARVMVKQHPAVKNNLLDQDEQAAMQYIISKCPSIPLLCYLSNASQKKMPAWGNAHREYFAANHQAQFIDMECGHYVHRESPHIIADTIGQLFS